MSLFTTAHSAVGVVTRHNDINIVFLLVTVIALMIIPQESIPIIARGGRLVIAIKVLPINCSGS